MGLRKDIEAQVQALDWTLPKQQILDLIRPSIRIMTQVSKNHKIGASKFGGSPDFPEHVEWPLLQNRPLVFLGQINFNELQWSDCIPECFKATLVQFFISVSLEDYRHPQSIIHKTIIHSLKEETALRPVAFPAELNRKFHFEQRSLSFLESVSLPSYEHWKVRQLELSDDDEEIYCDEVSEILNESLNLDYKPGHQLFGYSDAIQGDANHHWAVKQLGIPDPLESEINEVEKKFEQLLQIDLSQGFQSISDGCAYYGYMVLDGLEIETQCELQNT